MAFRNENKKTQQIVEKNRDYVVVKHNRLIQKSRHNLSLQEQKIILYLVSKIKPEDKELQQYEFKIKEFCKICGIDHDNGKNYSNLKKSIKVLTDKSFWIKINEHEETIVRWIERPTINHKNGTIKIKIDEYMRPFLLQLREQFTQYNLYYTLAMRNKYSIRLYELLKSYENLSKWEYDFLELSRILFAENYVKFYDFKRRVLEPAIKEINNFSDIFVTYESIKKERACYDIIFTIKPKQNIDEKLETWANIEQVLNPKQLRGQTGFDIQ